MEIWKLKPERNIPLKMGYMIKRC